MDFTKMLRLVEEQKKTIGGVVSYNNNKYIIVKVGKNNVTAVPVHKNTDHGGYDVNVKDDRDSVKVDTTLKKEIEQMYDNQELEDNSIVIGSDKL